jgi:uncharacterized protein YgbK (DUF1537 family)
MADLVIIADDLTGAADTGSCFATEGFTTFILMRTMTAFDADVIVSSTESRDLDAVEASAVVGRTVRGLLGLPAARSERWYYKKIDSALRGHPRDELLATMTAVGADRAIVAPAFPDEGRTTIGGRQYIDGWPVEASGFGSPGSTSDLLTHFAQDGMAARLVDLETVRRGVPATREAITAQPSGIIVVDAETDQDLATLAAAVGESRGLVLCGAAGFARQLAPVLPIARVTVHPGDDGTGNGPILVVAGSRHDATARQIESLRAAGASVVRLGQAAIESVAPSVEAVAAEAAAHLEQGRPVVVTTVGLGHSALGGRGVAALLADVATDSRIVERIGGLVLTGGDVAKAVCDGFEVDAIRLRGDVTAGIPWGTLTGGVRPGLPVVTKAGSFGSEDAMVMALRFLASRAASVPRSDATAKSTELSSQPPCQPGQERWHGSGSSEGDGE